MDKKILRDEYERQAEILISGDLVDADLLPPRRLIPGTPASAVPAAGPRRLILIGECGGPGPLRPPRLLPGSTE